MFLQAFPRTVTVGRTPPLARWPEETGGRVDPAAVPEFWVRSDSDGTLLIIATPPAVSRDTLCWRPLSAGHGSWWSLTSRVTMLSSRWTQRWSPSGSRRAHLERLASIRWPSAASGSMRPSRSVLSRSLSSSPRAARRLRVQVLQRRLWPTKSAASGFACCSRTTTPPRSISRERISRCSTATESWRCRAGQARQAVSRRNGATTSRAGSSTPPACSRYRERTERPVRPFQADVRTSNGVIHAINRVLIPPQ